MAELNRMRWYRSIAVKSIAAAFVATHVPLLSLVALVVLAPNLLSPGGVLTAALGATLLAAVLVTLILYRLFRPLQRAADALRSFMTTGKPMRLTPGAEDEVGRLVGVLVMALAHLDRSRAPLLKAGGMALEKTLDIRKTESAETRAFVLIEVDKWCELEATGDIIRMQQVQSSMVGMLLAALQADETMLPWGRGRFLLSMQGSFVDATTRLNRLCTGFRSSGGPGQYSCSAALESCGQGDVAIPAMLQRLEHKLFSLRLDGRFAQVA